MSDPKKPSTDWESIEKEYRLGQLSIKEIARQHGITHPAILKKAKAKGWVRDKTEELQSKVAAALVTGAVTAEPSREQINVAVATAVEVVLGHRTRLQQLKRITDKIANQLEEVLEGKRADIDVLGPKESISDAALKLSNATKTIIASERQAFNVPDPGKGEGEGDGKGKRKVAISIHPSFMRKPKE